MPPSNSQNFMKKFIPLASFLLLNNAFIFSLPGHEIPFCIKMNHARQSNARTSLSESEDVDGQCFSSGPKCEFILKKKKNAVGRLISGK